MPKGNTYDVFISYRRQGGAVKAELTKDELAKRGFRDSRMFLDTRSLTSGNYLKTILDAIAGSRNIVVIVTKDCFKNLPTDSTWVREIEYAIELHKNIVPVYFDGITELKADEIPSCIQRLAFENAVQYVHQYADASFDRLASRLSKEPIALPKWSKWLIGAVAAGSLAAGGYTAIDNAADLKPGEVYVVNSSSSKSYHIDRNCATLKNAKHRVKKITEEEAVLQGKKPCKRCMKTEKNSQQFNISR